MTEENPDHTIEIRGGAGDSPYFLSSVNNALKVLDVLSVRKSLGLTELSKILGLNKTTVFKLLFTLQIRNYVLKTVDNKYTLGSKFANFGIIVAERQGIAEVAALPMRLLRNRCRETIHLGMLNSNGRVIIIHTETGTRPSRVIVRIGLEMDAYTVALGKVLLAYSDPAVQNNLISNMIFKAYTLHTICTPDELVEEIIKTRERGYGEDLDERQMGYGALAAPIFSTTGTCIGAISFVCKSDLIPDMRERYLPALMETAKTISRALGY